MPIGEQLETKLKKKYEAQAYVEMRFKGNDIAFKTDESGNAILLFIGEKQEDGKIKGTRYARTLKHDRDGKIIKDHWEQKGKAS